MRKPPIKIDKRPPLAAAPSTDARISAVSQLALTFHNRILDLEGERFWTWYAIAALFVLAAAGYMSARD